MDMSKISTKMILVTFLFMGIPPAYYSFVALRGGEGGRPCFALSVIWREKRCILHFQLVAMAPPPAIAFRIFSGLFSAAVA